MEKCENCSSMISQQSYELHIIHCSRYFYLCSCMQMISSKEKNSHDENIHKPATCSRCGLQVEFWQLNNHSCVNSFIQCQICELHLSYVDYNEHFNKCKARTTQCLQCKKFFPYEDMKKHNLTSCMPALNSSKSQNEKKFRQKKNKKSSWVSLSLRPQNPLRPQLKSEDFDHKIAEDLLEEIVNSEIDEEEKYNVFTKF